MKKFLLFLMLLLVVANVKAIKIVVTNLTGVPLRARVTLYPCDPAIFRSVCGDLAYGILPFTALPISSANLFGRTEKTTPTRSCCFDKAYIRKKGDKASEVVIEAPKQPKRKPCVVKTWKIVAEIVNGKLRLREVK